MTDHALPRNPEDFTAAWLSEALGTPVGVVETEQIGIGVGLLGRLYRLKLDGEGAPASVIAKLPTQDEGARMNVVEPLRFYEKEIRFYTEAAGETPVATPTVHFAEFDAATGDFVLLLEDFGARRMCDQTTGCAIKDAEIAVDGMIELHAHWWQSDRFAQMPWLPVYSDPPYPQVIAGMYKQSWPAARELFETQLSDELREYGERFAELVPWFVEAATVPPLTLCHGDFRLDNVFFGAQSGDPAVALVDWQICFRGRGGYDLAYFVSQSLSTEDRRSCEQALIDRYKEGLAGHGVSYGDALLDEDYRRTVAYCFIYPVVSAGQIEFTNERHRALVNGMLDRAVKAIEDTKAFEILPS